MDHDEVAERDECGFSLIEVIVAMMLLAMVALLTVPFFALSLGQTASSTARTSATAEVAKVLEEIRAAPVCPLDTATRGPFNDPDGKPWFSVDVDPVSSCATNAAVLVKATARRPDGTLLATASTMVYVP